MEEQLLGKNYSRSVNLLILIFPIVINSLQVAGDLVLFILAMMGIFISISKKLSPFTIQEIKVFSYLTFGYFFAVCMSVLFSGQVAELAHYIPRDFHFLFAPFIALALFKAEININYLIVGVKVSLLILGIIIFNQLLSGVSRPSGIMNAGVFGNLAVSLFFISLVFFQQESFKNKLFTLLSLLSGLFIIIASGTRGAWLSFLILIFAYLYFFYKQKTRLITRSKIIVIIAILGIISFASINQKLFDRVLDNRTVSSLSDISSWTSGDQKQTSVSLRLEMYKKAIINIEDVPFFGYGLRTSNKSLFKNDTRAIAKVASRFNHLHNAYLTNYYNGGVFLLGGLLLILFIPLLIFVKANIKNRDNPIFISGVLLTLGYASYGMVNILFGDTYMNGFYVFFLALFLVLTYQSKKKPEA